MRADAKSRADAVSEVIVVVPVHNEAELLDRCLTALGAAVASARRRAIACDVMIVLDECTDGSADIARTHPFPVAHVTARTVGAARAHGVATLLARLGSADPHDVWIANTDADSAVPANWIVSQCELAAQGADVVLGTVRPDFADLTPRHRRHWLDTHAPGAPAGNVHGANLGVRADVYLAAGGFDAVAEHEDVGLVARARALGARVSASDDAEVLTSGRHVGRTPGGYAAFVRELAVELNRGLSRPGEPVQAE
jgi:GT2 family glycosyltransferase